MHSPRRLLAAAALLACAGGAQAATDAEVSRWLSELTGSALVLQELAGGPCSGHVRSDDVNVDTWFAWGASLGSPALRAGAERTRGEVLAQARTRVRQWLAEEVRRWPQDRPLQASCTAAAGMFRTILLAAESELENFEQQARGRVTPRAQR